VGAEMPPLLDQEAGVEMFGLTLGGGWIAEEV